MCAPNARPRNRDGDAPTRCCRRAQDAIAAIAADIGFDDPTAFHRAFRLWTGSTPGAYRRGA